MLCIYLVIDLIVIYYLSLSSDDGMLNAFMLLLYLFTGHDDDDDDDDEPEDGDTFRCFVNAMEEPSPILFFLLVTEEKALR